MTEPLPALGRIGEIDDDVHTLLFDAERRDLGEPERLHPSHDAVERLLAAPGFDQHRLPRAHPHRFGGQQVRDDFQIPRIADLQQRRAGGNHCFAFMQYPQHAAAHGRGDFHAVAIGAAPATHQTRSDQPGAGLGEFGLAHALGRERFVHGRCGGARASIGCIEIVGRHRIPFGQTAKSPQFGLREIQFRFGATYGGQRQLLRGLGGGHRGARLRFAALIEEVGALGSMRATRVLPATTSSPASSAIRRISPGTGADTTNISLTRVSPSSLTLTCRGPAATTAKSTGTARGQNSHTMASATAAAIGIQNTRRRCLAVGMAYSRVFRTAMRSRRSTRRLTSRADTAVAASPMSTAAP